MKKTKKIDLFKSNKMQLITLINTLENKISELESIIKDELYNTFLDKLKEPANVDRLRKENKKLRLMNKKLKEVINESKSI